MPSRSPSGKRPRFLMLSGWHSHAVQVGVARYVRKVGGILDAGPLVTTLPPDEWRGDGIVCMPGTDPVLREHLERARVPVVLIHRPVPTCPFQVCIVGQDDPAIGAAAANHLLDQGLTSIAYCVCLPDELRHPVAAGRLSGMRAALAKRGLPCHIVQRDTFHEDVGRLPGPVGLLAQNDYHAVMVLDRCMEHGLAVPDDVAVIGCDNDHFHGELAAVPLSSVETRCELLGERAAEILHLAMSGRTVPERVTVPCGPVVPRASTSCVYVAHQPTSRAIKALRERFRSQVDLDALAAEVGMSRRRLEDRFHEHLGRSMADELQRIRLMFACGLLEDPSLKLSEIARRSGLGGDAYFSRVFRQATGRPPGRWRRDIGSRAAV